MREFVEIESVEPKVGDLVYKAAILRANTKVLSDIEIGAAAIHEGATRLPFRSSHDELVRRIEDQRSTSAEYIRPDASHVNGNVRD